MDCMNRKTSTYTEKPCLALATKVLGDKWTPRLLLALSQGTLRFCMLQDDVGGINPRTLSLRLANLEEMNIITKTVFTEIPLRTEYTLTKKGKDLLPILYAMTSWSEKYS